MIRLLRGARYVILVLAVVLAFTFSISSSHPAKAATLVGPKTFYLALGDSLGLGFQPNGDNNHGYADDFFVNLQSHGAKSLENLSCSGETTITMINGGCIDAIQNK